MNFAERQERNAKIIELYESGLKPTQIIATTGFSRKTIYRVLKEKDIHPRVRKNDLTGLRFSRLIALEPAANHKNQTQWLCLCDCGNTTIVRTNQLNSGTTRSCGCLKQETVKICSQTQGLTVGRNPTTEYRMYHAAKSRARKYGIPFTIEISDILVPEFCPILGIRLERNTGSKQGNSPSLDKVIPELGYVKGNIEVISMKANMLKSNGSYDEFKSIVDWFERRAKSGIE